MPSWSGQSGYRYLPLGLTSIAVVVRAVVIRAMMGIVSLVMMFIRMYLSISGISSSTCAVGGGFRIRNSHAGRQQASHK